MGIERASALLLFYFNIKFEDLSEMKYPEFLKLYRSLIYSLEFDGRRKSGEKIQYPL